MTAPNEALAADRAVLWNLERHAPGLHIAGLAQIEGRIGPQEVLQRIDRLRRLPQFALRVETPPFGSPRWRSAPLAPERHFHVAATGDPVAALDDALGKPLDSGRPLWEVHLLPGYHDRGDALLVKAHLAAVDGLGTKELFGALFDSSSKAADDAPEPLPANGSGGPAGSRTATAVGRHVTEWFEDWKQTGQDLFAGAARLASEEMRTALLTLNEVMPDVAMAPRPLPFNRALGGRRRLIRAELSYADIRTIRSRLGGALSDIVLAVVGGALERYLANRGTPIAGRSLKVALASDIPHRDGQRRRSVLPIEVPLRAGAAERLHTVHQLARLLRAAGVADALARFAGVQRAAGSLAAAATAIGSSVRPPFHLTVANATGPHIPQYLAGRPVTAYTPSWPIGFGQGLSCAFFAYNQLLHVGLTVDERACPDAGALPDLLVESLSELRQAAGSAPRRLVRTTPPSPQPQAVPTLETS